MTRQAELDLAKQARTALDNPALTEAFARYEKKIVELLRTADVREVEMVMTYKRHLTSLAVVRRNLEIMVADGEEARQKINYEQTFASKARSAIRRIA